MDQSALPLVDALAASAHHDHAAFYAPGHKRGQGVSTRLKALLGAAVFQADLPELPELDNLFAPEGPILEAQQLAADAFEAEQTWFLANGTTCGLEAAVLSVCRPGDKILVPRNAHQSVISALILSGAVPVFGIPDYDAEWDLVHGLTPATVALALEKFPDIQAVLIVSPTYHGVCAEVAAIANLAHQRNLPLLVDEAHGPHFAFHPDLPPTALSQGADLVVQSTHKVLSALSQASMLHVQGNRIDRTRLQHCLQLTQSTSPSYLLLASLDAARHQMAGEGQTRLAATLLLAKEMRGYLTQTLHLPVFTDPNYAVDLTRITVGMQALSINGFEADTYLHEKLMVTAELPALNHLTFIVSLGNRPQDALRWRRAWATVSQQYRRQSCQRQSAVKAASMVPLMQVPQLPVLSPRDAFFADTHTVPLAAAMGQISADMICPYPPGIPLLLPGERITAVAIQTLVTLHAQGGYITGGTDPTLTTLRVVR